MWAQLGAVTAAVAAVLLMTPAAVTQRIKRIEAKLEFQKRATEASLVLINSSKPLLPRGAPPAAEVAEVAAVLEELQYLVLEFGIGLVSVWYRCLG